MIQFLDPDDSPLGRVHVSHPAVGPLTVVADSRSAIVRVEWGTCVPADAQSTHPHAEEITMLLSGLFVAARKGKRDDAGSTAEPVVAVSPRGVSPLMLDVMRAVARVPRGSVASYADIARESGHAAAVRAVATAVGGNPIPVIIPCHRVLPSATVRRLRDTPSVVVSNPSLLGHYTPSDHLKPLLLLPELRIETELV